MTELAVGFNFLVVVFVLWYYGRQPLGQYLVTRSDSLAKDAAEADALSSRAQVELSKWQALCDGADSELKEQRAQAEATLARARQQMVLQVDAERQRTDRDVALICQSEQLDAVQGLNDQFAHASVALARQYLKEHIDRADEHRLISDCLEGMANGQTR